MRIEVRNLTHIFNMGTVMETCAVRDVSFTLEDGCFAAIIGHTGSGKSTLIQHLNGLEKPTSGTVLCNGEDIFAPGYDLRRLRGKVGLIFQNPENQLFEETVIKDVMYGPGNLGYSEEECRRKAETALHTVGLEETFWERSPFELSGGEKRKAAVAGILAMEPEVLILDEPAAGLDPKGRREMLEQLKLMHEERGLTVLMVSHSMDDVAEYAERLLVMEQGRLIFDDTPKVVFTHIEELEAAGLSVPEMTYLARDLRAAGFDIPIDVSTIDEAEKAILAHFSGSAGD